MSDQPLTQDAQVIEPVKGTVKFGLGQISNPTPVVLTWIFRIEFLVNKAFGIWLASQTSLDLPSLKNLVLWATIIDGFFWGIGKFFGVSKDDLEK